MGVAVARNTALKQASGEYILFMDSDDFIDHFYLESMYEHAVDNNQDVVKSRRIIERIKYLCNEI